MQVIEDEVNSQDYKAFLEGDQKVNGISPASLQGNIEPVDDNINEQKEPKEISYSKANGETLRQMTHAHNVFANQECTSKDQKWEVDPSLAITDKYCMVTSYIFFLIKVLVFVIPSVLFAIPIILAAWAYGCFLQSPTERVQRTCGFYTFWIVMLPFTLPFIVLATVAYIFDSIFYVLFSVPWFLVRCCIEDNIELIHSYACIRRYRNGPSIWCHLQDMLVVLIGQILRQGPCECIGKLAFMIILVPWIKYYINTNPWLYSLDERFVQQITTSMKDMEVLKVANACRQIISRAKQNEIVRDDQDGWKFAPHYPYPPSGRNWALGVQAAGNSITGMFLIVHTTHALEIKSLEKVDPNYFVLSNTVESPIYRVMLWYNNPYHFFTGYVEASVSTGGNYQQNKINGGEHPMWLLTSRSPMLTKRKSKFGVGWIDNFFDFWLPFFVFEIRKIVKGVEYACNHYEKVISKDGVSPPAGMPGCAE